MSQTESPRTAFGIFGWTLVFIVGVAIVVWTDHDREESALEVAAEAGCRKAEVVETTKITAGMRGCFGKRAVVYDIAGEDERERPMTVAVCCRPVWGCDRL